MIADDVRARAFPRYPIYIPTRGRYKTPYTVGVLLRDEVPFYAVVVPSEAEQYAAVVGPERILVLPSDDYILRDSRNWIRDHATAAGHARHWQLDDNINEFRRLFRRKRIPCASSVALRACEDFTDRYANVAVSGLAYQMFVMPGCVTPFNVNVHVYSCVVSETPVLCADLVWRSAESLSPGDQIVAFDEEPTRGDGRPARAYRTATVERNDPAEKPCRRVATDLGRPVIASDEHPWLVLRRPPLVRRWLSRDVGDESSRPPRLCWVTTADLRVGDRIAHLARPWTKDESHDGGWIAGMFDGEGSLVVRSRTTARPYSAAIAISQKEGPVLDRLRRVLVERGYSVANQDTDGRGTYLRGGFAEALRFAGEFRPTRMIDRLPSMWEGRKLWRGTTYDLATVTAIESVGIRPVASISTSSGTFVTGGYLTHNCTLVNNQTPYRWRLVYNDDTDLCLQALAGGWCTILLNAFMANKMRTMIVSGGNTDTLYQGDGRLEMARSLERAWPGVVTVYRRFGRPQHRIDWTRFTTPLQKREDVGDIATPDYGLTLVQRRPVRSESLRELLDK